MNKVVTFIKRSEDSRWLVILRNISVAYFLLASSFLFGMNLLGMHLLIKAINEVQPIIEFLREQPGCNHHVEKSQL